MRKLPVILGLALLLGILLFPACEVENCPPNTISYAHFTLVDQMGKQFNSSDTITVIGETVADVTVYDTLPDGGIRLADLRNSHQQGSGGKQFQSAAEL